MIVGLVTLAVLGSGVTSACAASTPHTDRQRARDAQRRARYVQNHPRSVTSADILARLRRDGIDPEQSAFIVDKAAKARISPFTMWLWLEQFDAEALGLVIAADLTAPQLLEHICNGTVPNLAELRLFAELNGLVLTGPAIKRREAAEAGGRGRTVLTKSHPMPEIFEPGVMNDGRSLALPKADGGRLPRLSDGRGELAA